MACHDHIRAYERVRGGGEGEPIPQRLDGASRGVSACSLYQTAPRATKGSKRGSSTVGDGTCYSPQGYPWQRNNRVFTQIAGGWPALGLPQRGRASTPSPQAPVNR